MVDGGENVNTRVMLATGMRRVDATAAKNMSMLNGPSSTNQLTCTYVNTVPADGMSLGSGAALRELASTGRECTFADGAGERSAPAGEAQQRVRAAGGACIAHGVARVAARRAERARATDTAGCNVSATACTSTTHRCIRRRGIGMALPRTGGTDMWWCRAGTCSPGAACTHCSVR